MLIIILLYWNHNFQEVFRGNFEIEHRRCYTDEKVYKLVNQNPVALLLLLPMWDG